MKKCNTPRQPSESEKEILRSLLSYNPDTGEISRADQPHRKGSLDKDGYLIIKVKARQYKSHRLAWFLYYGKFPEKEIDHINHNRTDNRIRNLREATRVENIHNIARRPNPDTGIIGVYKDKATRGLKKHFVTRIDRKVFRFYTKEEAARFRQENNLPT